MNEWLKKGIPIVIGMEFHFCDLTKTCKFISMKKKVDNGIYPSDTG